MIQGKLESGHYKRTDAYHIARVVLDNGAVIPARSECNRIWKVEDPVEEITGVLDPASLKNGTHTGAVLVEMKENIPVRMVNLTSQRHKDE